MAIDLGNNSPMTICRKDIKIKAVENDIALIVGWSGVTYN